MCTYSGEHDSGSRVVAEIYICNTYKYTCKFMGVRDLTCNAHVLNNIMFNQYPYHNI